MCILIMMFVGIFKAGLYWHSDGHHTWKTASMSSKLEWNILIILFLKERALYGTIFLHASYFREPQVLKFLRIIISRVGVFFLSILCYFLFARISYFRDFFRTCKIRKNKMHAKISCPTVIISFNIKKIVAWADLTYSLGK